jgi:hypothetical protein
MPPVMSDTAAVPTFVGSAALIAEIVMAPEGAAAGAL